MHNRDERSSTRNDTLPRAEIPFDQHQKRWLLALRHSNADAFDALYKALSEPLLRYAWMLTRDEDMIYDIVQEAFLKLWHKRAELDPEQSIKAWLFRVVRNLAYKAHRTRRIRSEVALDREPSLRETPESSYIGQELDRLIQRWVSEMPPRRREVFQLSRVECLSHQEIADVLAISGKTVNNHLVEGLRFLRGKIRAYGLNE